MHSTTSLIHRVATFIASTGGVTTSEVIDAFSGENEQSIRTTMTALRSGGFLSRAKNGGRWHTYTVNAKGRSTFGLKSGTKNGTTRHEVETAEADTFRAEPSVVIPSANLTLPWQLARQLHLELGKVFG